MTRSRKIDRISAEAVADQRLALGIVESNAFGDLTAGMVVKVQGLQGKCLRGKFTIRCFRLDPDTGACKWVSVVGGSNGTNEWRSFDVSRIVAPKKPRRRSVKEA